MPRMPWSISNIQSYSLQYTIQYTNIAKIMLQWNVWTTKLTCQSMMDGRTHRLMDNHNVPSVNDCVGHKYITNIIITPKYIKETSYYTINGKYMKYVHLLVSIKLYIEQIRIINGSQQHFNIVSRVRHLSSHSMWYQAMYSAIIHDQSIIFPWELYIAWLLLTLKTPTVTHNQQVDQKGLGFPAA